MTREPAAGAVGLRIQTSYDRLDNNVVSGTPRWTCPYCESAVTYGLSDGRRKCKQCRKKFTPQRRTQKVTDSVLRELAGMFWHLVSADRAADALGVNRKTVLRHYSRIRQSIAEESRRRRQRLIDQFGVSELAGAGSQVAGVMCYEAARPTRSAIPNCRLVYHCGEVTLFLPSDLTEVLNGGPAFGNPLGEMPTRWPALLLHQRKDRCVGHSVSSVINSKLFREIAGSCAKAYRAAFKKDIPLFMREVEFRYNRHMDAAVVECLFGHLKPGGG